MDIIYPAVSVTALAVLGCVTELLKRRKYIDNILMLSAMIVAIANAVRKMSEAYKDGVIDEKEMKEISEAMIEITETLLNRPSK